MSSRKNSWPSFEKNSTTFWLFLDAIGIYVCMYLRDTPFEFWEERNNVRQQYMTNSLKICLTSKLSLNCSTSFNLTFFLSVDAPEVRLEGTPVGDLEEGTDVVLRCVVDSNPPSMVRWKTGDQRIVSTIDTLQFRPVKRRDSGTYYCEAHNSVGRSAPLSAVIDVKCKYNTK